MIKDKSLSQEGIENFKDFIITKIIKRFKELNKWNNKSELMLSRTLGAIEGYRNTLKYLGGIDDRQANILRDNLLVSIETEQYTKRHLELDIKFINNHKEDNNYLQGFNNPINGAKHNIKTIYRKDDMIYNIKTEETDEIIECISNDACIARGLKIDTSKNIKVRLGHFVNRETNNSRIEITKIGWSNKDKKVIAMVIFSMSDKGDILKIDEDYKAIISENTLQLKFKEQPIVLAEMSLVNKEENRETTNGKDDIIEKMIIQFENIYAEENRKDKNKRFISLLLGMILGYRTSLMSFGGIDEAQADRLREGLKDIETDWYTKSTLEFDIDWMNKKGILWDEE